MAGKTLATVKAELLRGIGTRKPVLLTVSKQKIAMAAQEQLRLEEETEAKSPDSNVRMGFALTAL